MICLDTNLLGRMTDKTDPQYAIRHHAVRVLRQRNERLVLVPQNLYEFWTVATRAKKLNGLEMTCNQAALWIGYFRRLFGFIPARPDLAEVWRKLVLHYEVRGYQAHDARLVAAMQTYGI